MRDCPCKRHNNQSQSGLIWPLLNHDIFAIIFGTLYDFNRLMYAEPGTAWQIGDPVLCPRLIYRVPLFSFQTRINQQQSVCQ